MLHAAHVIDRLYVTQSHQRSTLYVYRAYDSRNILNIEILAINL